ncbi:DEAD/DEAH box helicase family protein [Sulfurimonas sp.]|nr:DEAD/DEAH box helicase family protein [Sulfurimonas sp.]
MHTPIMTTPDGYLPNLNIKQGSRTLLSAPTNSGKTTYAMKDSSHKYTIVIVPKRVIAENKQTDTIPAYMNGKTPNFIQYPIWISTYDNIVKVPIEVLTDAIVYIDEVHTLATIGFRTKLPQAFAYLMGYAKTVVGMSGTLNPSVFNGMFTELITVKSSNPKDLMINNILCPPDTTALTFALYQTIANIDNGKKVLLLIENIHELSEYEKILRTMDRFKHDYSILKYVARESDKTVFNRSEANRMIDKGVVPNQTLVICCTSALVEGWDLKNKDEWTVVICGSDHKTAPLKTPENAVQFANRLRLQQEIIVQIQRNSNTPSSKLVKSDKQLRNAVQFQRSLALEEFQRKGNVSLKHLCKLEDKIVYTDLPLLEARQSNINTKFAYGKNTYDVHAELHGVIEVIETEFECNIEKQFEVYLSLEEAILAVFNEAPHYLTTTERHIDNYLDNKENSYLPDSFKSFIATCGKLHIKAKDRLMKLKKLMRIYSSLELTRLYSMGVSVSQLLARGKDFRGKGISRYRVRSLLLDKLGNDIFHTEKEVRNALKAIPSKYFNGKLSKSSTISERKNIKSILGGFVNYTSHRQKSKGKLETVYRLEEEALAQFTVDGSRVETPFLLAWINEKTRYEIMTEIEHTKLRRGRMETISALKKTYANYVEFFDNLDEVA